MEGVLDFNDVDYVDKKLSTPEEVIEEKDNGENIIDIELERTTINKPQIEKPIKAWSSMMSKKFEHFIKTMAEMKELVLPQDVQI